MKIGEFGIDPDQMLSLPAGHVIDAIPADKREGYYFRGASVGALALNLAYGVNRVNPRDDMYMHVATGPADKSHSYARGHAEMLARGGTYSNHMTWEELAELATLAGHEGQTLQTTPGIVLGFAHDQHPLVQHPRTVLDVVGHAVPFADIDPYSREALSELWGIDLAALPPTPDVFRPIPEAPPIDVF